MFFDHLLILALIVCAVIGLAGITLMTRYPRFSYILLFLSIVGGQLARLSLGTDTRGGSAIIATDVIVILMCFAWIWRKLVLERKFALPKLTFPIQIFLIVTAISVVAGIINIINLVSPDLKTIIVSISYYARFVAYALLYFITQEFLAQKPQEHRVFLFNCIFVTSILVSIGGFVQLIVMPDFTPYAIQYGWDPHVDRLLGTFFDPNFIGSYFAFILAMGMGLYPTASKKHKVLIAFSILFCSVALLLTFSRTGYVAFLAAFFLIGLMRSPKLLIVGTACIALGLISSPRAVQRITDGLSVDETGLKRVYSWDKGTRILTSHPIFGVGYNNLATIQDYYSLVDEFDVNNRGGLENSLLTVFVTTGIFGGLAYIWLWFSTFKIAFDVWKRKAMRKVCRNQALAIAAGLLAFVVSSIFMNSLLYPFILVHIWIASALIPDFTHDSLSY